MRVSLSMTDNSAVLPPSLLPVTARLHAPCQDSMRVSLTMADSSAVLPHIYCVQLAYPPPAKKDPAAASSSGLPPGWASLTVADAQPPTGRDADEVTAVATFSITQPTRLAPAPAAAAPQHPADQQSDDA